MFSVSTFVRRAESRRQTLSVCGSLLVHAGVAACLLYPEPSTFPSVGTAAGGSAPGVVSVHVVRTGPAADQQSVSSRSVRETSPKSAPALLVSPDGSGRLAFEHPVEGAPKDRGLSQVSLTSASLSNGGALGALQAPAADSAIGSDYQRRLLSYIEPFKQYPDEANRAGIRGVVHLVFELDRQGRVLGVWVRKSSGSASLDAAAVETLRRAQPLPPIPAGLPDALAVQLPVEFDGPG